MTDTNGNALVVGQVYAGFIFAEDGERQDTGVFVVVGEDGKLYDADREQSDEAYGDELTGYFDELVKQA